MAAFLSESLKAACPDTTTKRTCDHLTFTIDEIARLPRQVQQSLGYDRHKLLGTWDWRAPLDCLDEIRQASQDRTKAQGLD